MPEAKHSNLWKTISLLFYILHCEYYRRLSDSFRLEWEMVLFHFFFFFELKLKSNWIVYTSIEPNRHTNTFNVQSVYTLSASEPLCNYWQNKSNRLIAKKNVQKKTNEFEKEEKIRRVRWREKKSDNKNTQTVWLDSINSIISVIVVRKHAF